MWQERRALEFYLRKIIELPHEQKISKDFIYTELPNPQTQFLQKGMGIKLLKYYY